VFDDVRATGAFSRDVYAVLGRFSKWYGTAMKVTVVGAKEAIATAEVVRPVQ
jgi:hypothetical protein